MVEPEDQELEETEEAADESEDGEERSKGERKRNFQSIAVQNLQRARKSVNSPDADVTPRATLLVQSANAWALLDLAEAIRSHGQSDGDEPDE
jgi:hypothetical protein